MINYIREREWLYRSLRTFFQTFISTLASLLVLNGENGFDRQILFSVSVSSVAAGISAVMNLNTKDGEKIE